MLEKEMPNLKHADAESGKIYGRYNTVTSVNPRKCYFIAEYPDGKIIKGNDLFKTGWDNTPQGLSSLCYVLSTGHVIKLPKFKAYMPLIEVSFGMDGSRIFHSVNIKCLTEQEVLVYRIILRQDNISKFKIGDVVISKEAFPKEMSRSWRYTN